jgi:hypothetical protein
MPFSSKTPSLARLKLFMLYVSFFFEMLLMTAPWSPYIKTKSEENDDVGSHEDTT